MHKPDPQLAIIYARSNNHCIGDKGRLPWSLPREYHHFEHTVAGHPVIMGRRSFEDHDGLIPNCMNIVVSRNEKITLGSAVRHALTLEAAIEQAKAVSDQYFVIGGAGLIREALPQARIVYETIVNADIDGDTYLPVFDFADWSTKTLLSYAQDDAHRFSFRAVRHARKQT